MVPLHLTRIGEAFSRAYVRQAVAAAAGFRVPGRAEPDDDGIDLTIGARPGVDVALAEGRPSAQMPTRPPRRRADVAVRLEGEELRGTTAPRLPELPRILVVVNRPGGRPLAGSSKMTNNCAASTLRLVGVGKPASSNHRSVRVPIPRDGLFDVAGLQGLMSRIAEGDMP
ncbi:MAG: DUF4365 domain-containing protein [Polyangiales bacterium]